MRVSPEPAILATMRWLRLWYACAKNCLVRQMEFKLEFFASWATEIVFQGFNIVYFVVLLRFNEDLAGWNSSELLVFLGTVFIVDGIMMTTVYDNMTRLPTYINKGELDFFLLKPVPTQFLVSIRYVRPATIMSTLCAVGIVIWGLTGLEASVTPLSVLLYIALCLNGLLILYATCFMFQTLSFWLVASQGFAHGYFMFYQFIMKPDSIYTNPTRYILTYIFPAIVIGSVPARVLLDKDTSAGMVLWGLALGLGTFLASIWLFKRGLRRYESASS